VTGEPAAVKARRYLTEGRVLVLTVTTDSVAAVVRGDAALHRVDYDGRRGWRCSCTAIGRCSHLQAVGLVVAVGSTVGYLEAADEGGHA